MDIDKTLAQLKWPWPHFKATFNDIDAIIIPTEEINNAVEIIESLRQQLAKPAVEWISVKDRVPEYKEHNEDCLYLTDGKVVIHGMFTKYDHQPLNGDKWVQDVIGFAGFNLGIDGDMGKFEATHWMLENRPNPPAAYDALQDK
jgi:hypothetical protein